MNRCYFRKPNAGCQCLLPDHHDGEHIFCGVRLDEKTVISASVGWGLSSEQAQSVSRWIFGNPLRRSSDALVEHLAFAASAGLIP